MSGATDHNMDLHDHNDLHVSGLGGHVRAV